MYSQLCEQLIGDENLLLQVLGFHLTIQHMHTLIIKISQQPIKGTSKELYLSTFQLANEINRITLMCVEYEPDVLAMVALYLAATFKGITVIWGSLGQ